MGVSSNKGIPLRRVICLKLKLSYIYKLEFRRIIDAFVEITVNELYVKVNFRNRWKIKNVILKREIKNFADTSNGYIFYIQKLVD